MRGPRKSGLLKGRKVTTWNSNILNQPIIKHPIGIFGRTHLRLAARNSDFRRDRFRRLIQTMREFDWLVEIWMGMGERWEQKDEAVKKTLTENPPGPSSVQHPSLVICTTKCQVADAKRVFLLLSFLLFGQIFLDWVKFFGRSIRFLIRHILITVQ